MRIARVECCSQEREGVTREKIPHMSPTLLNLVAAAALRVRVVPLPMHVAAPRTRAAAPRACADATDIKEAITAPLLEVVAAE